MMKKGKWKEQPGNDLTAPVTAGTCEGRQLLEGQSSKRPTWGEQNLRAFGSRGVCGGGGHGAKG